MTRISLNQFEEYFGADKANYPRRLADNSIEAHMIEFDNPEFLGGPFAEKYGLATIMDCRNSTSLKTETQLYNDFVERQSVYVFNYPREILRKSGFSEVQEYLLCHFRRGTNEPVKEKEPDTFHVMAMNTLEGSRTLAHPYLTKTACSNSQLNGTDLIKVFKTMVENMEQSAVLAMLDQVEKKIKNSIAGFMFQDFETTPSIERPYLLTITGNDDSSWGKVFESVEEAQSCLANIEKGRTLGAIYEHLKSTN